MAAGPVGVRRLVLAAAAAYAVSRLVAATALALAHAVNGLGLHLLLIKWDAHWYLDVARLGYPASLAPLPNDGQLRIAFFPLLPLLLRPVVRASGDPLLAATVVTTLLGLAATVAVALLARMVALDGGTTQPAAYRAGMRSAWLFALAPGAIVLSLVYTEGLAVLLAVGCLAALLRGRWLLAGVAAGLATATRPNALALVAPCAAAAAVAVARRREWRALAAPALAPAGFLGYLGYLQVHTGSWRTWGAAERAGWHQSVDLSVRLVRLLAPDQVVGHVLRRDWDYLSVLVGLAFLVVALLAWRGWHPPLPLTALTAGVLVVCFASSRVGPRPRMLLLAVPLFLAGARLPTRGYRALLVGEAFAALAFGFFVATGRVIP